MEALRALPCFVLTPAKCDAVDRPAAIFSLKNKCLRSVVYNKQVRPIFFYRSGTCQGRKAADSKPRKFQISCQSNPDDRNNSTENLPSKEARIRSEVTAPYRSIRMFFSLAFIASGTVGALISIPRIIASLGGSPNASPINENLIGLGIDLVAVLFFVFLYRSDSLADKKSIARFTREETLSKLRLELWNKQMTTIGQLRGARRLLIVSGTQEFLEEVFRRANPLKRRLVEKGVLIVPYAVNGTQPSVEQLLSIVAGEPEDVSEGTQESEKEASFSEADLNKRFLAMPLYTNEWERWLDDQMKLAGIPGGQPVYISLRLDGRVRASGVGLPPLKIIAEQLPPLAGIWAGPLDGLDGRV